MANIVRIRSLAALAIFLIVGNLMFDDYGVSAESCGIDVPGLILQCSKYVSKKGPKVPPSPECCSVIKLIDVPCACKLVTKDVESKIDMEKAVYVCRTCGLDIPKGMQCGSYTVPDSQKVIIA